MNRIVIEYLTARIAFLKHEVDTLNPLRGGKTYKTIMQAMLIEAEQTLKVASGGKSYLEIKK